MPRPKICRWIRYNPRFTCFKPTKTKSIQLEESVLTKDELEAIRLHDLEQIDQKEASKKMKISQPTFHRVLIEARKKIADALINGKFIRIEGGNIKMLQTPRFGRGQGAGRGAGRGLGRMGQPPTECVCSKCGYKEPKVRGVPCRSKTCPKCGSLMIGSD